MLLFIPGSVQVFVDQAKDRKYYLPGPETHRRQNYQKVNWAIFCFIC